MPEPVAMPSAVEIAHDIVRMDTVNPPGGEAACAHHLGMLLEAAGFAVGYHDFAPGRTSVVARLKGRGERPPICFAGHLDVVPLGARPWSVDPFGGEIAGERIYGRGTSDMKAGIAAFVRMGLRLAREAQAAADLVLVLAAGEETGCEGSRHLRRTGAVGPAGAIVIAEPSSNHPILGHRGALWLEVATAGVTAHGSMSELGVNAIYKAARLINRLEDFGFNVAPDALLGRTTLNVGTCRGGININSVPDRATFTVDVRSVPGHDHADILAALASRLGPEAEITCLVDVAGVLTAPTEPWVREVFDIVEPVLGERPAPRGAPYFTDASELTPACGAPPTLILGPGEMAMAHQTDEYCLVANIEQAAEIYERIARRWCGL